MKSLASLFVLIACFSFMVTDAQTNQCTEMGGSCLSTKSSRVRCDTLPASCDAGKVCCKGKRGARSAERRKCYSDPGICVKEGGHCVVTNEANNCAMVKVDSLCIGSSCSCCLGEKKSCNGLPSCKLRGGICMNSAYVSSCPSVDEAGCRGAACSCCYLRRSCKCGMANGARIVGGEAVLPKHKYPWMAIISDPELLGTLICGASIINDLYLLTAAHCVFNSFAEVVKPRNIKIGVAEYNRVTDKENVPKVTKYLDVREILVHEKFDPSGGYSDDIALIKLKNPLDLSAHKEIRSVCLPSKPSETYEGKKGIVTGWGIMDYEDSNSFPNVLQEVSMPILSPACEGDFPANIKITKNMICAGYVKGGKDACKGDSGGPMVVREGDTYTLVGLVSFGFGCADRNVPGVYTRVSKYLDWIAKNTVDAYYCS